MSAPGEDLLPFRWDLVTPAHSWLGCSPDAYGIRAATATATAAAASGLLVWARFYETHTSR